MKPNSGWVGPVKPGQRFRFCSKTVFLVVNYCPSCTPHKPFDGIVMRILIISNHFSLNFSDGTLANDLALELRSQGNDVVVYAQDWFQNVEEDTILEHEGIRVFLKAAAGSKSNRIGLLMKWLLTSRKGWKLYGKEIREFDPETIIAIQTLVSYEIFVRKLLNHQRKSLMIQWDFFPYHHAQIGKLNPGIVTRILAWFEGRLIGKFDYVAHMTTAGSAYFRKHFPMLRDIKSTVIPIWGPNQAGTSHNEVEKLQLRREFELPTDKIIAVFGGQLARGRGIENLVELAIWASVNSPEVYFVFVGSGELSEYIGETIAASHSSNMELKGRISRDHYQDLLSACDIGLVSTDGEQDAPTFPSKSIDYFRNRLPILASLEASTDAGRIIEEDAVAGFASVAGDARQLRLGLEKLADSAEIRKTLGENGLQYYLSNMTVKEVAGKIMDLVQE